METIESFSDFLKSIGAPNFLVIGIVLVLLWLLISGLRKGLSKRSPDERSDKNDESDKEG